VDFKGENKAKLGNSGHEENENKHENVKQTEEKSTLRKESDNMPPTAETALNPGSYNDEDVLGLKKTNEESLKKTNRLKEERGRLIKVILFSKAYFLY